MCVHTSNPSYYVLQLSVDAESDPGTSVPHCTGPSCPSCKRQTSVSPANRDWKSYPLERYTPVRHGTVSIYSCFDYSKFSKGTFGIGPEGTHDRTPRKTLPLRIIVGGDNSVLPPVLHHVLFSARTSLALGRNPTDEERLQSSRMTCPLHPCRHSAFPGIVRRDGKT